MQLTKNFSMDEFIATSHRTIDNTLPDGLLEHALLTCNMLERIRSYLSELKGTEVPINLSSGYRCLALNTAVGGSTTSDHIQALAADWTARKFGTPYEVCKALAPKVQELGIGQLIHEYGRWTHTSVKVPKKLINRILTINKEGTFPGIRK